MSTRAERAAKRREAWHGARVDEARTPRQRFWAAAGWLLSEAIRAGRVDDAVEVVLTKTHEIREEATA